QLRHRRMRGSWGCRARRSRWLCLRWDDARWVRVRRQRLLLRNSGSRLGSLGVVLGDGLQRCGNRLTRFVEVFGLTHGQHAVAVAAAKTVAKVNEAGDGLE